jgi:hypothetical protein
MDLYNTTLWNELESARLSMSDQSVYCADSDKVYNIPAKKSDFGPLANNYYSNTFEIYGRIVDCFKEIEFIVSSLNEAPRLSSNDYYSTDFILNYLYKDWIIRVNVIFEQTLNLINHIYRLQPKFPIQILKIAENSTIKSNKKTYAALHNLYKFLYNKILKYNKVKSIKKGRNNILHEGDFHHSKISDLTLQLFSFKYGLIENYDDTDIVIDENIVSINIKKEIADHTKDFFELTDKMFNALAKEFSRHMKRLLG